MRNNERSAVIVISKSLKGKLCELKNYLTKNFAEFSIKTPFLQYMR
jgi:hypothetical protein